MMSLSRGKRHDITGPGLTCTLSQATSYQARPCPMCHARVLTCLGHPETQKYAPTVTPTT